MPKGAALDFIRKGHRRHADPGTQLASGVIHWEYDDSSDYSAIAKIELASDLAYEGVKIRSNARFSSRYSLEGSILKLRIPAIPEATALSLNGKTMEQVVNDPRLHGWGWTVRGLIRNNREKDPSGAEISDIHLDTNRGSDATRLCFSTNKLRT